ncbi:MAG: murein transglycosylase A [Desulfatibacillaceae bacterium]
MALLAILFCVLAFCAMACTRPDVPHSAATAMVRVEWDDVPELVDDKSLDSLVRSLENSRRYYRKVSGSRSFTFGPDSYTADWLDTSMAVFIKLAEKCESPEEFVTRLRRSFVVYRSVGRDNEGGMLFTGYYEPVLKGSRERTGKYRFPLYRLPDDIYTVDLGRFSEQWEGKKLLARVEGRAVLPYHDRRAIDREEALAGRNLEIVWLEDPVSAFFLHIQGSGRVVFPDGTWIHAHYAGVNGRPYRSVGRLLIDEGKVTREKMSMQAIRRYLEDNPEDMARVMDYNESYVFFEEEDEGPLGCLDVPLTPGRSVATDRRLFPEGAIVYIRSRKPVVDAEGQIMEWTGFGRFAANQDTGGAIRGPGRLDLFWGRGDYAEIAAGHMKHPGELYFFVLDPEAAH